jgi:hypothetical protein
MEYNLLETAGHRLNDSFLVGKALGSKPNHPLGGSFGGQYVTEGGP